MANFRFLTRITRCAREHSHHWMQTQQFSNFKYRTETSYSLLDINQRNRKLTFLNHSRQYKTFHDDANLISPSLCNHSTHLLEQLNRKFSSSDERRAGKSETKASAANAEVALFGETANLGLFAKFKHMYKKYWYVLIPVHVITSIGWFGAFYYLSKSGVDIAALLHYINISESIIDKVQHSDMGHYAFAYLCYKIATPVRYAVTLAGTTVSIKILVQAGHIKPIPTKTEFIAMIEKKKADREQAKLDKFENSNQETKKEK